MKLLLGALLIVLARSALAQPFDLEAIAKQPGTEVSKRTENGGEVVEIRRGGVTVTVKDGKQSGFDNSGHGAVLCTWELMVSAKAAADVCFPGEFADVASLLQEEIEMFNDFIAANSLRPVTKDDLKAGIAQRASRMKAGSDACLNPRRHFLEPLTEQLRATSRAEVKKKFDEALAVPRPPVLNPCL
jgi:uncharacterized protein YodC (DUF2158 family)